MRPLFVAVLVAAPLVGRAEEPPRAAAPRVEVTRDGHGARRYTFKDPLELSVRAHLPRVFYILPRTGVGYDDAALDESLVVRIRQAVDHDPF